ncbi:MAG TPA: glycosyltransferase family 87 protein [Terriglobia bacterium]|nr:glycosyltransferase family 87 protein [Terriglobia bacterium]
MNNPSTQIAVPLAAGKPQEGRPAAPNNKFWPRELALGLLAVMVTLEILAWVAYVPVGLRGVADFRSLYTSGYMARTHHAHELYDRDIVQQTEQRLVPVGATFSIAMDHPAYEEVLFVPLSLLPYRVAFVVFVVLNLGVVVLCVRLLSPSFRVLSERWKPFPALLFAAFFPITKAITTGQDSVVLLALLAGAFVCIQRRKEPAAGFLAGLGLFKFQVVIPIALLFLLWKRWRFVLGFAISTAAAGLASVLLVGVHGTRQYASMLLGMSVNLTSEDFGLKYYALSAKTMLNLRGLLSAMFEGHLGHWWLQGLIAASSVAVIAFVARRRPSLPLAIVAAALVSYHLNAQDASILMIPMGLCLCSDSVWAALAAVATLVVPVTAVIPWWGYFSAIPILALLFATASRTGSGCPTLDFGSREPTDCAL